MPAIRPQAWMMRFLSISPMMVVPIPKHKEMILAEFPYIKEQTGATAGNLSVQIDKLSTAGYIEIEKTFKGKRPCTICRITQKGRQAFEQYVEALKDYLEVASKG